MVADKSQQSQVHSQKIRTW